MNVSSDTCLRCHAPFDATNAPLTVTKYGCDRCRGKRPEVTKTLGQEDEAHLFSKVNSG